MDQIEQDLIDKGYLCVTRHMHPGNSTKKYTDMCMKMSVIWIPCGPVGNGHLHEYRMYFRTPNDILDFAERIADEDCEAIHDLWEKRIESGNY